MSDPLCPEMIGNCNIDEETSLVAVEEGPQAGVF